jgi:nucleoside-diphosphate-sugar epimerase
MTTVLVTGAAGFLGSRVVAMLSDHGGYEVIATDVVTSPRSDELATLPRVAFHALDLRDHAALREIVQQASHVVHLAAMRSKASQANRREGFDVNVRATFDLFSIAADHGVRGVVYGSSHLVYGAFADPSRTAYVENDASPARGLSLYSAAKLACEAFLPPFADGGGFDYVALRFGGIYGPGAAAGSNTSLMLDVLTALDKGDKPFVSWCKDSLHALIYVDDAARAVVEAVARTSLNDAVNVVGPPVTTQEIYSTLVRLYGRQPDVLDWREERSRYQRVSGDRLRSALQCPPVTTLDAGLQSLIERHRVEG